MAESAPVSQAVPVAQIQPKALPFYQSRLKGMIVSKRIYTSNGERFIYTVLRLPAANEFSHPATVEVRSSQSIGNKDDIWDGVVVIGGMPNNFEVTDEKTGELTTVYSARVFLTVVE